MNMLTSSIGSTFKRTQKKHIRHCLIAMDNFHRNLLTLIFSQKVFFAFKQAHNGSASRETCFGFFHRKQKMTTRRKIPKNNFKGSTLIN